MELVYPNPSSVKGVKMNSDHSDEDILADPDPLGTISSPAVDPKNSKILYAAAGSKDSPALFISRNAGSSWQSRSICPTHHAGFGWTQNPQMTHEPYFWAAFARLQFIAAEA